jgi:serine/threonine-protein kinase RsbW
MNDASTLAIECTANAECLGRILEFVDDACSRFGVRGSAAFDVKLAVEEVCTNVIQYGYEATSPGPLAVTIADRADSLVIVVNDRAAAFDPSDAPAADTTSAWNEREAGGLGLHLVRNVVDEMHYATSPDGLNSLTLIKRKNA